MMNSSRVSYTFGLIFVFMASSAEARWSIGKLSFASSNQAFAADGVENSAKNEEDKKKIKNENHPYKACRDVESNQKSAKNADLGGVDCPSMCTSVSARNVKDLKKAVQSLDQSENFKLQLRAKVSELLDVQIKMYEKMERCFQAPSQSQSQGQVQIQTEKNCDTFRALARDSFEYDFQEMKLANALANPKFPKERPLQKDVPWLRYSGSTRSTAIRSQPSHLMRDLQDIPKLTKDEEVIAEARYREAVLSSPGDRKAHDQFYRENQVRYLELLSKNPALGYIQSSNPSDAEIAKAFGSLSTRLKSFRDETFGNSIEDTKWDRLFAFGPLGNEILRQQPELCGAGYEAFVNYSMNEKLKTAGHLLAGFAAGFSCLFSGPVCLVAGLSVSAKGIHDSESFLETQFMSAISLDELEDYSKLADAERVAWIEKAMLPMAMVGAGKGWSNFFKTSTAKVPAEVMTSSLLKTGLTETERTQLVKLSKDLNISDQALLHLSQTRTSTELREVSAALVKIHRAEPLARDEAVRVAKFLEESNAKGLINFHLTRPENLARIQESGMMRSKEYKMRIFAMSSRSESGQYFKMGSVKGFGEAEVVFQGEAAALFKDFKPSNPVHALHAAGGHQGTESGRLIIDAAEMVDAGKNGKALVITKAHMEKDTSLSRKAKDFGVWAMNSMANVVYISVPATVIVPRGDELNRDPKSK